jgi:hypothetical protein
MELLLVSQEQAESPVELAMELKTERLAESPVELAMELLLVSQEQAELMVQFQRVQQLLPLYQIM